MTVVNLTDADFDSVATSGTWIVDCWATWCGPCRAFAPVFEAVAASTPGVGFAKVDVDAAPGVAARLRVQSVPTVVALVDGVEVGRFAGAVGGAALAAFVHAAHIA